jgi:hypothetical protein
MRTPRPGQLIWGNASCAPKIRRKCRGETASRAPSAASVPVSSTPSMISWTARHTSSGAPDAIGPATRYGRQRRQARNPAASALAASSNVWTFSASGFAPQPGRQLTKIM